MQDVSINVEWQPWNCKHSCKHSPQKGYLFQASGIYKGKVNQSFRYLKMPLIIIFRIHAPYGCISLFIKH